MKLFVAICLWWISSIHLFSQNIIADSDSLDILDTLDYNGKKIVLFNDNTWTFVSSLEEYKKAVIFYDTSKIFRENWNNNEIFVNDPSMDSLLTKGLTLVLVDSLHQFVMPHYGTIYSGFGWRGRIAHKGLDIGLEYGTPVRAAFDGKVRYAQYNTGGYGKLVIIRHPNQLETFYAHLSKIYVKPNQIVKAGQVIGTGGRTGRAWGTHLHFETRWNGKAFDPLKIIDFENQKLRSDTVVLLEKDFKIQQNSKAYARGLINGEYVKLGGDDIEEKNPSAPIKAKTSAYQVSYSQVKAGTYHLVRQGETLWSIAKKYGTTVDNLCKLNNIERNSTLRVGQKLKIK